jgi:bifunctional UDP-N-acetylglucosamine pyrophosphorylase/glucosamine-1-phosphate N-acetyltransferase
MAIVLAAGKGTRMVSQLPKALHEVCGLPMAEHVGRAMSGAGASETIFVVGHGAEEVKQTLGDRYRYVEQTEQFGTGHACLMALPLLGASNRAVLVGPADAPLVSAEAMSRLRKAHCEADADCTIATCILADPTGYGRIVRDDSGKVTRIVEELDATEDQRKINEINAAFYCFSAQAFRDFVPRITNNNEKGEYYLTDLVQMFSEAGKTIATVVFEDFKLMRGVNDRWQLAEAGLAMRERILKKHALAGVTLLDPQSTFIGVDVEIGSDTEIAPMTSIFGQSKVGSGCRIGPSTHIISSRIGDRCLILMSHLNKVDVGDDVRVGPFANLRPKTKLGSRVKVGNFVEVKNAQVADDASMSHLSYVGDATVGARSNIGAGTITCNYDGFEKHQTTIGEDAFVGSNSTLIAPVEIGDRAITGAGSVINQNVPEDSLAVGRGRQEVKEGWAKAWRSRKQRKEK